uniref:Uncharacterized protein n=1 Tax=Rhizophora mucronata TaxID=61149 RepID=A0A2P2PH56_RHIMU
MRISQIDMSHFKVGKQLSIAENTGSPIPLVI